MIRLTRYILPFRNSTGVAKNAEDIANLKKMVQELNEKSQADEKRVSEMNVNVENLNMNVSLQHRTVIGLIEDRKLYISDMKLDSWKSDNSNLYWFVSIDKELIDEHTKEINDLKNR